MTATLTMQRWIDAKTRVETLTYGLRALTGKSEYIRASDPAELRALTASAHARQITAAAALAQDYRNAGGPARNRTTVSPADASSATHWIRWALGQAKEELADAEAAKKAIGGIRQLRLAIGAECDCFGCGEVRLAGGGEYYCAACIAEQNAAAGDELATFNAYHEWADRIGAAA